MWQIPIPNWTGILTGFCPGVIVGIAAMIGIAWWGNRQDKKRKEEPPKKTIINGVDLDNRFEFCQQQEMDHHREFIELAEKDQTD